MPAGDHFCGLLITFCKLFGPRSGPRACRSSSGSKLFDTDVIPERFFLKVNCEKYNDNNKKKSTRIIQHAKSSTFDIDVATIVV